jgi:tRNA-dihydrouridine synthase
MLAARQILAEDFQTSPWVKRRPGDGFTFYQLMVRSGDPVDRVLDRLGEQGVEAVDLNLACDAFSIRACEAGSSLFEDLAALELVARVSRRSWPGTLTAKVRLGGRRPDWRERFTERVRRLEANGFDALVVHPRFFDDKFRRRAQLDLLPWVASLTRLPLIANGDLVGPASVAAQAGHLQPAGGIMIGRMAVARPWLFAHWDQPEPVDYAGVWRRLCNFIAEDFPPAAALRRVQKFTKYYAANFAFGHSFWVDVGKALDLADASRRAEAFFARSPAVLTHPVVAGL